MTSPQFTFSEAGRVDPRTGWQLDAGKFTQQDRADLVGYHPSNGTVWVGRSTGRSFAFERWGTLDPAPDWQIVAADFTGDGRADVAAYHPSNGTVWVGVNRDGHFEFSRWGQVTPAAGWQFAAGDFWGRAVGELVGHHPSDGRVCVGQNTGGAFEFARWATLDRPGDWKMVAADFTGDGRTDIAAYHPDTGRLFVGKNRVQLFDTNYVGSFQLRQYPMGFGGDWTKVVPGADWQFGAGYFTGRFGADLFCYRPGEGTLWVGASMGEELESLGADIYEWARYGFSFSKDPWFQVAPPDGWQFVCNVFDGDLWSDVVGYHPGNGSLWIGQNLKPIEGYCWPLSAAPGQRVSFMLSAEGNVNVSFRRHTSRSERVEWVGVGARNVRASAQEVPPNAFRTGCGWVPTLIVDVPASWRSGIYSAHCVDAAGNATDITFIVKPAPAAPSQVAVLANVNTWLAYNGWGGQSKYSGLARTSFLQPMPNAAPLTTPDWWHLTRGELWVLGWLEAEGYAPHVFSDIDFHDFGCDPQKYKCLVLSTHPEYWTTQMYDNLATYLTRGGSLVYLGGNGIFESGEYNSARTGMRFRRGVEGGLRLDAIFRRLKPCRAERTLLGVATERCGGQGTAYEVLAADHELFAGTGLSNHALFGTRGLNRSDDPVSPRNGQASGWEVDTYDGEGALKLPWGCTIEDGRVTEARPPAGPVKVLARGQPEEIGGTRRRGADMIVYDHPGGGFVFSVGSITFGGSLVVDSAIQRLMRNVFAKAGVS